MSYRELPPPPDLAGHVQCLWSWEGESGGAPERIVPDGRCEILVQLGEPYEELGEDGAWWVQPRALVAGQLTRPLTLRNRGRAHVVSVRFKPAGARPFLDRPMARFTDRRVPLAEVWGGADGLDGFDALVEALRARLKPGDGLVARAAEGLEATPPATVAQLVAEAGLSDRQLARRFEDAVGVPPRTLAAVFRFRRVFDEIDRADGRWAEAALASGYFDQPQLSRDFRRFLGCTATEFARTRHGLSAPLSAARR